MITQAQSDRIWEVVFRAAERDPAVRALLFAKPVSGDSNPGAFLLSTPLPAPLAIPTAPRGAGR